MRRVLFVALLAVVVAVAKAKHNEHEPVILIEQGKASYLVGPSRAASVRLPTTASVSRQGRGLAPIDSLSPELRRVLREEESLSQTAECSKHTTERLCVVDVSCGWCMVSQDTNTQGGMCVEGNYVGPRDKNIRCPVYTTYQTQEFSGSTQDTTDISWEPLDVKRPQRKQTSPALSPLPADNPTLSPLDEVQPTLEDSSSTSDIIKSVPEPDTRDKWTKRANDASSSAPTTVDSQNKPSVNRKVLGGGLDVVATSAVAPKSAVAKQASTGSNAFTPQPFAESKYDASVSPCGLPGVPPFVCTAWIKTHCGADQLTDHVIKNLPAANNGYDWCSMMFENNPQVFLPSDVANKGGPFPWFINGNLVQ
eukprot:c1776_g1_i1.p1 GENE.c1776_g1_i1~~c1776_g1_i1.p1  ORF type:complete len:376 (-),score=101.93 c1776_g1_i1:197-1291(-)